MDQTIEWNDTPHPKGVIKNAPECPLTPEEMVTRFPIPEGYGNTRRAVQVYACREDGCALVGAYIRDLSDSAENSLFWVKAPDLLSGEHVASAAHNSPYMANETLIREEYRRSMVRYRLADLINQKYYDYKIPEGEKYDAPEYPPPEKKKK